MKTASIAPHRCVRTVRIIAASLAALFLAAPLFAQATTTSPWENAVGVLQQAFTSTIARGLSLVAIVVSGLTFAFALKSNIGDSLHVVVQIERRPGRRYVSEVLEINSYDPDADLFDYFATYRRQETQA